MEVRNDWRVRYQLLWHTLGHLILNVTIFFFLYQNWGYPSDSSYCEIIWVMRRPEWLTENQVKIVNDMWNRSGKSTPLEKVALMQFNKSRQMVANCKTNDALEEVTSLNVVDCSKELTISGHQHYHQATYLEDLLYLNALRTEKCINFLKN